jgi:hypothetical protein
VSHALLGFQVDAAIIPARRRLLRILVRTDLPVNIDEFTFALEPVNSGK